MTEPRYDELAKRAREAVRGLDTPFSEIAYRTILEDLIRQERGDSSGTVSARTPPPSQVKSPSDASEVSPLRAFMERVKDAEPYISVLGLKGHLIEKCLVVLKLARDELSIDGLTPGEITDILIKKFRVAGVHSTNVSRDLGSNRQYVTRVKGEGRPRYIITSSGDSHLKSLSSD